MSEDLELACDLASYLETALRRVSYLEVGIEGLRRRSERVVDWISVDDQMPARDEYPVLARSRVAYLTARIVCRDADLDNGQVTHWMRIPPLPPQTPKALTDAITELESIE